jgi:magnesium chelatase subunit I
MVKPKQTGAKMIELLDEYIPFVTGSEINDDPFNPISRFAKDTIAAQGEQHLSHGYIVLIVFRKLATPDVTVAD